jgi:hypothetical protein
LVTDLFFYGGRFFVLNRGCNLCLCGLVWWGDEKLFKCPRAMDAPIFTAGCAGSSEIVKRRFYHDLVCALWLTTHIDLLAGSVTAFPEKGQLSLHQTAWCVDHLLQTKRSHNLKSLFFFSFLSRFYLSCQN